MKITFPQIYNEAVNTDNSYVLGMLATIRAMGLHHVFMDIITDEFEGVNISSKELVLWLGENTAYMGKKIRHEIGRW